MELSSLRSGTDMDCPQARDDPFVLVLLTGPITGIGVNLAAAKVAAIWEGDCRRLEFVFVDSLKVSTLLELALSRGKSLTGV